MNDQLDGEIRALLARVQDATPLPRPADELTIERVAADRAAAAGDGRRTFGIVLGVAVVAVLAVAGLGVLTRGDRRSGPPAAPATVASTVGPITVADATSSESPTTTAAASPIDASSLPYLEATQLPTGFSFGSHQRNFLPNDGYGPATVLLGLPRADGSLAPVTVGAIAAVGSREGRAFPIDDVGVTGWIRPMSDVPGEPGILAEVNGPHGAFHVEDRSGLVGAPDVVRLAEALVFDGSTIGWAVGSPPHPFVDLLHQSEAAAVAVSTYQGPDGALVSLVATSDFGINGVVGSDPGARVERRRFGAACDGVLLTISPDGPGTTYTAFCRLANGVRAMAHGIGVTLDQFLAVLGSARLATNGVDAGPTTTTP